MYEEAVGWVTASPELVNAVRTAKQQRYERGNSLCTFHVPQANRSASRCDLPPQAATLLRQPTPPYCRLSPMGVDCGAARPIGSVCPDNARIARQTTACRHSTVARRK